MKNNLPDDVFLFGASYAPYAKAMDWPMDEWERDLALMRELHFNTIRIFAAWDRIERTEGVFDYSKPDRVFELAAKEGLHVILNFGGLFHQLCGLYPPSHLADLERCQRRVNAGGEVSESTQPSLCLDDPIYRERAFAFMERTVRRYAGQDALLAWMIWNEPQLPQCHCPWTQERFRRWVQEKYGDLAAVNERWGTEHPMNFQSWDQIRAPQSMVSQCRWADWIRFNQWRLHDAMKEIAEIVQHCDPRKRPTTTNFVYHMAALKGAQSSSATGLNLAEAGQAPTIAGLSYYTTEHEDDQTPAFVSAYKLSRLRSVSRDKNRRLLVLETGAGPNLRTTTETERRLTFWHLIGHNAKSLILWNYRSRLSDGQVALFNLMKWDGSASRRARCIAEFSKMLQQHAKLLNKSHPGREAAILTLEDQQIQSEALCDPRRPFAYRDFHDSRIGAYKLLWDLKIPADCIAENNLDEMGLYKVVLLPMCENITPEMAHRIRNYVEAGGTVVAESPFAFRDGDGHLQYRAPAWGLEDVFGCWTNDRDGRENAPEIRCAQGTARVHFFWSEYELTGGRSLADYEKLGTCAFASNRHGKGRAFLAGTEVFRQYVQNEQPAMTRLLKEAILESGATPSATFHGDSDNIEVCQLRGSGGVVYIIINHNERERRFRIALPGKGGGWLNMQTESGENLDKEITLGGREVLVLIGEPKTEETLVPAENMNAVKGFEQVLPC